MQKNVNKKPKPAWESTQEQAPLSDFSAFATTKKLLPFMWPRHRPDLKRRVLWAIFCLILAKIVLIAVPYFFKFATNALVGSSIGGHGFVVLFLATLMLVLPYNLARIVQAGFNQLRDILFAKVAQAAVRDLAHKTFGHILDLSLQFHIDKKMGGLARVVERGTKGLESVVRFTLLSMVPTILEFMLSAFILLFCYGWVYFFILIITIIAYVWFSVLTSNWRIKLRRKMNDADTKANGRAVDSLLNFETVKYFCNEEKEADRFNEAMAGYEKAAIKTAVSLGFLNFGQNVIFGLGMAILMGMTAYAILQGRQSLGDFIFINTLLVQLSVPLNFIGVLYRELRQGLLDIATMFVLLEVPQDIKDKPEALPLKLEKAIIKFDKVSFSYVPARPILKEVEFEIEEGKKLAVVGPSGAGKSTLSHLLYRFYDPQSGRILINGQDIRNVQQKSLRAHIGIVPQDTVLFHDSILYNIRYGRLDASLEEVIKAAQTAQIHDFITSLPEGYDTLVGERGLKLSGGEKQRVAIARTILKNPPILVFDEATSALDSTTEQEIQTALDVISADRTTIVIAHRLSTIINADVILVLKNGRIVEKGSFEELLEKEGEFATMWRIQQQTEEQC